jgi:hypothetical protein
MEINELSDDSFDINVEAVVLKNEWVNTVC